MTRLAVLADIHSNWPALEAVRADMAALGATQAVVAGDVVHRGPFSAEVMAAVTAEGWPVIRGNNEDNLLAFLQQGVENHDSALPLTAEQLSPAQLAQIVAWPEELTLDFPDAPPIRVFHGQPGSPTGDIHQNTPDDATLLPMLEAIAESFVISGHIHLQVDRRVGRWQVFNPGAVGMPFDGDRRASYVLLDAIDGGWRPTFRRVAYDVDRVLAEFERLDYRARAGAVGRWIIEEVKQALPLGGPYMKWMSKQHPGEALSIALFEAFLADPDRQQYVLPQYDLGRAH